MRLLPAALLVAAAGTVDAPAAVPGPAVRLSAGASDTVVINSRRPTALRVRALDAAGRPVPEVPIRYARVGGARLPATADGVVTCTAAGDVHVRATLALLVTDVVVRCRPVEHLRIPGPVQFIIGDSTLGRPRALPVEAYDRGGRRVHVFAGSAHLKDPGIASYDGLVVHPTARGLTLTWVVVGDRSAAMGLHVYERVESLAALDTILRMRPEERVIAVPFRLAPGEMRRQRLPPGPWMLTMLPEEDTAQADGLHLRIEGARCTPMQMTPRRFGCDAGPDAHVIVYRPFGAPTGSEAIGYLLVRPLFP